MIIYPSVTGNQEIVISLNYINHFAVQISLSILFCTDILIQNSLLSSVVEFDSMNAFKKALKSTLFN